MASPYTVLVTGSSGHLGAALMLSLPSAGHIPLGIDILPSPTTTTVGSVTDRALVASILATHASITHIVHAATLHKPHVDSHPKSAFIDTNITGTLVLLEEAARLPQSRIKSFIFVSTTSTFGTALSPKQGQPAAWIDESVTPIPKNIYGVTKCAAEDLCSLVHRQTSLPVLVLRTSRFFPEPDDDEDRRAAMGDANLKVCELAYRRVDIADVVSAVVCGMERASALGFGKYIISAPPPFAVALEDDSNKNVSDNKVGAAAAARAALLRRLDTDAGAVFAEVVPGCAVVFEKLGWTCLGRLDRVYDSSKAVRELGWRPQWTIGKVVEKLSRGEDWRSELTHKVGKKGYHAVSTGVYTTRD
ncbi:NAD dependent epimerase/dehydratase [Colletotrichum orchidophilum]|uniref:NAD dependent epimerase/dehydratase n=1 Tax=Colletotrichum orchidophilum TaxID=1209926 RepID=A0A1G4ATF5_9PEZI|nr:NAD dependent epimerase/dehydratase [Colletotrichum orchidophilum]OHE92450.1 NAD dependent epimerase/dehydratase [Colletotrichum orchidophilum]